MSKNVSMNVRVNLEAKKNAEAILSTMGITLSEAFNLLLYQINLKKAIPFNLDTKKDYKINDLKWEVQEHIEEYESGKEKLETFSSWEEAKEWLDD